MDFIYERSLEFCFSYDKIGHIQRKCMEERVVTIRNSHNFDYRGWLCGFASGKTYSLGGRGSRKITIGGTQVLTSYSFSRIELDRVLH